MNETAESEYVPSPSERVRDQVARDIPIVALEPAE